MGKVTYGDMFRDYRPYQGWKLPPPPNYGLGQVFASSFRQINPLASVPQIIDTAKWFFEEPTDYDPYPDIPDDLKQFSGAYWKASNREDTDRITAALYQDSQDREVLANAGWTGIATQLVAGALDPVQMAIPGSYLFKVARTAGRINRLQTMARTAALAGLTNIPSEMLLQMGRPAYTAEESVINTLATSLLTGLIGGAVSLFHPAQIKEHVENIKGVLALPAPPHPYSRSLSEIIETTKARIGELETRFDVERGAAYAVEGDVDLQAVGRMIEVEDELNSLRELLPRLEQGYSDLGGIEGRGTLSLPYRPNEAHLSSQAEVSRYLFNAWEQSMPGRAFSDQMLNEVVESSTQGRFYPIEPMRRYPIDSYPGLINESRERYKPWKTILKFPGKLVDKKDARWLHRLLPSLDSTVPAHYNEAFAEALQEDARIRISSIEDKIDSLQDRFNTEATIAYAATDEKSRNAAVSRARSIGEQITSLDNQVEAILSDFRLNPEQRDIIDMVKVQRGSFEYYVPRDVIENDIAVSGMDGVHSGLDEIPSDIQIDDPVDIVNDIAKTVTPDELKAIASEIEEARDAVTAVTGQTLPERAKALKLTISQDVFSQVDKEDLVIAFRMKDGNIVIDSSGTEPRFHFNIWTRLERLGVKASDLTEGGDGGYVAKGRYFTRDEWSRYMKERKAKQRKIEVD